MLLNYIQTTPIPKFQNDIFIFGCAAMVKKKQVKVIASPFNAVFGISSHVKINNIFWYHETKLDAFFVRKLLILKPGLF